MKKHLHIIPVGVSGVVVTLLTVCSEAELGRLLCLHSQQEWNTATKRGGLLVLQDAMLRLRAGGKVSVGIETAHSFVTSIKRPQFEKTVREPLAVLCYVGLWCRTRGAINLHVKRTTEYALTPAFSDKVTQIEVKLSRVRARKWDATVERKEKRLNRKYAWRERFIQDQARLAFLPEALNAVSPLLASSKCDATKRALAAITQKDHCTPTVSVYGTIRGTINDVPRELKPLLAIDGQRLAAVDISHAHHCFLTIFVRNRIEYSQKGANRMKYVSELENELTRLRDFLSDGDYYAKWSANCDADERGRIKRSATQLLNMETKKARCFELYRRMTSRFPLTFAIVEDIKRKDHRALSKQLQRLLSDVIVNSLLKVQALGIPALPDTDALHVPAQHTGLVSRIIGTEIYSATDGVCCKAGGTRYIPGCRGNKVGTHPKAPPIVATAPPLTADPRSISELCNSPIVRMAKRMFDTGPFAMLGEASGRAYRVRI